MIPRRQAAIYRVPVVEVGMRLLERRRELILAAMRRPREEDGVELAAPEAAIRLVERLEANQAATPVVVSLLLVTGGLEMGT